MFGILGENNPRFGQNHSELTKAKMSESSGTAVKVLDLETAVCSNYVSMSKAAEAMGVSTAALSKRFKKANCFILKGRYQIEKKQIG
jgi:hypothetical protein